MPSEYRAALPNQGALFVDVRVEQIVADLLESLRAALARQHHRIRSSHSIRYINQLMTGDRPMPVSFLVSALMAAERLGGRELVRRILEALARPFGLTVVPRVDRPTTDARTEEQQASRAACRALITFADVTSDHVITDSERHALASAVIAAQQELSDLVEVTR